MTSPDPQQVAEFFRLLHAPDLGVIEVRAIPGRRLGGQHGRTAAQRGYFTAGDAFVDAVVQTNQAGYHTYATLNPVQPALHQRAPNRLGSGRAARDADIAAARWLWVDVDPVRSSDSSATEAERTTARTTVAALSAYLEEHGHPRPVMLDSGNGYWLLLAIAPVTVSAANAGQANRALKAWGQGLAARFTSASVKIDTAVYNLSRIVRVPGTINWKGPGPHRGATALTPLARHEAQAPWLCATQEKPSGASTQRPGSLVAMERPGLGRVLAGCQFVRYCRDHAADLSEPLWYDLALNLAPFAAGRETFHQLSAPYPAYTPQEAEGKFAHAAEVLSRGVGPTTCGTIAGHGFACPRLDTCPAGAPAELATVSPQAPGPGPSDGQVSAPQAQDREPEHRVHPGDDRLAAIDARLLEIADLPEDDQTDALIDLVPGIAQLDPLEIAKYRQRLKRLFGFPLTTFDALVQALHKGRREREAVADAPDVSPRRVMWDGAPRPFRQALDYHRGRVFTVVTLYERISLGEADREPVVRRRPYLVTSERELVPVEKADLLRRGLVLPSDEEPFSDSRWSPPAVRRFVQAGYTVSAAAVFVNLVSIFDYYIEFQPVGELPASATCHLAALDVMKTYFVPAFSAIGYPLHVGEKESGKTKLQRLQAKLSFLGEHITAGATMAALKRMAAMGYSLYFDDVENIRDRGFDPDKRAIILAGNTRGVTVPLVEEVEGKKVIRRLSVFCQKGFTNIQGIDDVLGSRVYLIPTVRAWDKERSSRDPEATRPPVAYQQTVDDLYTLAMTHMSQVEAIYRGLTPQGLTDREFQIWRPIVALARLVDAEAPPGGTSLAEEMVKLALAKRQERATRGEQGFDHALIQALARLVLAGGKGVEQPLSSSEILDAMHELAPEVVWRDDEGGEPARWPRGLTVKLGRTLRNLRALHASPRTATRRGYLFTRQRVEALAQAYGVGHTGSVEAGLSQADEEYFSSPVMPQTVVTPVTSVILSHQDMTE